MAQNHIKTPKGTRDFAPIEMARRNYIFDTIRTVYEKYGYRQIETPAMEELSTLTGKYGDEGDKLLFKILNSGDYLGKTDREKLSGMSSKELAPHICEKGLRYDLTVPLARYVTQHRNEISFPFRRYQIQPVWRADRPQKGRYREFYQCDADIVGSDSLINELEFIQIFDEVLSKLGFTDYLIKFNNRKLLNALAQVSGMPDKSREMIACIDKLDKMGTDKVKQELEVLGLSGQMLSRFMAVLGMKGPDSDKLKNLSSIFTDNEYGRIGIEEVERLLTLLEKSSVDKKHVEFDPALARGLDYYTGTIFEVKATESKMGSICGGGRYDNLTGIFGLDDMPGVGISFGAERIYDLMLERGLFPAATEIATQVMFVNFGEKEAGYCVSMLNQIRKEGYRAELYPDPVKMKKQMAYADSNNIPYVALVGEEEMSKGMITVKDMKSGEQLSLSLPQLINRLDEPA